MSNKIGELLRRLKKLAQNWSFIFQLETQKEKVLENNCQLKTPISKVQEGYTGPCLSFKSIPGSAALTEARRVFLNHFQFRRLAEARYHSPTVASASKKQPEQSVGYIGIYIKYPGGLGKCQNATDPSAACETLWTVTAFCAASKGIQKFKEETQYKHLIHINIDLLCNHIQI